MLTACCDTTWQREERAAQGGDNPHQARMIRTHHPGMAPASRLLAEAMPRMGWGQAQARQEVTGTYLMVFGCKLG